MKEREMILKRLACAKSDKGFDALVGEWMVFRRGDGPIADSLLVASFCAEMEQLFARDRGPS